MEEARAKERPLLILFTALEWSANARALGDEVFLAEPFNDFARDHLTLVFLDYPRRSSMAPASAIRLKEHYAVRGYPSVVVVDQAGKEIYHKTGYSIGKPERFLQQLKNAIYPMGLEETPPFPDGGGPLQDLDFRLDP